MSIENIKKSKYGKALLIAANEAYQSEIVDTKMGDLDIGECKDFATKEDWIENQIALWLEAA